MGIVLGYVCLLFFCILIVKSLSHIFHLQTTDRLLRKMYYPILIMFIVFCTLHIYFVFPVINTRNILVSITGLASVIITLFLFVIDFNLKNKIMKNRLEHMYAIVVLLFVVGHIVLYFLDYKNYESKIEDIQIGEVTIADKEDGEYIGEYDAGYIYVKVELFVKNGEIYNINILEHNNERGSLAEKITEKVIDEQRIDVDAMSGATNSSLVIIKAIENALK